MWECASVLVAPFEECNPWKYDVSVSFHAVIICLPNVCAISTTESTFHHIILSLSHLHCKECPTTFIPFLFAYLFRSPSFDEAFFQISRGMFLSLYEKGGLSHSHFKLEWRYLEVAWIYFGLRLSGDFYWDKLFEISCFYLTQVLRIWDWLMDILEDQGVTTFWCGLDPEFVSNIYHYNDAYHRMSEWSSFPVCFSLTLLRSHLQQMLVLQMDFWLEFVLDFGCPSVLQSIRLMFCYRSDEQVKLICCYYCTSVTGYSSTEDVLTLQEDSLILER